MEYRIEEIGNATVIRLKGSFDRSARGKMEIELLSLVNFGSHLIFDFTEVDFISSAGLHLLLDLHRRCEGQHADMVLTGLSEQIRNLLAMTGFAPGVLSVYNTLEDGLAAIRSKPEPDGSKRGFDSEEAFPDSDGSFSVPKMEEEADVNFSAFYPKEVVVEKWYTLLVYTYVPSMLESVHADARKFEDEIGVAQQTKPASTHLSRGTEVTIVPTCEGVAFNPERISFQWLEDRHRAQFRMRADASLADMAGNARVTIYVGPLIVGELKMGMLFNETEAALDPARGEEVSARIYRQDEIFISYSHRDTDIVQNCKKAYEALGHNVLIDFETLRSGQKWNAELMRMIERANIFQLFWSENSSASEYCRQEWQHALSLGRGEGFIRPVYWKEPIPMPPAELSDLHFDYISLSQQG